MEVMHRAKYGERMQNFYALSRCIPLQYLDVFANPETPKPHMLVGFMEASSYRHDRSVTPFPAPLPFLWGEKGPSF